MIHLFPSLALGGEVKYGDLVKRDELFYKKFTNIPFTGAVTGQYQGKIRNGKFEGPWFEYFKNGQLQEKGAYKNGKRAGTWITYSPEGTSNAAIGISKTYRNGIKISD